MFNSPSPVPVEGFYGSFPADGLGYIGNSAEQKNLTVEFNVTQIGTIPDTFTQIYTHYDFVTSCKEFDKASLVRIDRAVLHVTAKPDATGSITATIDVYAVSNPYDIFRVFIKGVKIGEFDQACYLANNSASSVQIPRGTFDAAFQPTAYSASCTFTWSPVTDEQLRALNTTGLEIGVHSEAGPTVATAIAKPEYVDTEASFNGTNLTVRAQPVI
jgi:hypothetical protein